MSAITRARRHRRRMHRRSYERRARRMARRSGKAGWHKGTAGGRLKLRALKGGKK